MAGRNLDAARRDAGDFGRGFDARRRQLPHRADGVSLQRRDFDVRHQPEYLAGLLGWPRARRAADADLRGRRRHADAYCVSSIPAAPAISRCSRCTVTSGRSFRTPAPASTLRFHRRQPNSQYLGARDNFGTNMAYEVDLPSAGGGDLSKNVWPVAGDYIWRTTPANFLELGLWGIMRVTEKSGSDAVRIAGSQFSNGELTVFGSTTVYVDRNANPKNGNRAATVSLFLSQPGQPGDGTQLSADVKVGENGLWSFSTTSSGITTNDPRVVTAISPNGGVARHAVENVILLGQPQTPQPEVQGESGRFVSSPRQHAGEDPPKDETAPRKLTAPKPIEQGKKPVTTPPAH